MTLTLSKQGKFSFDNEVYPTKWEEIIGTTYKIARVLLVTIECSDCMKMPSFV